jgi:hypothetical protein
MSIITFMTIFLIILEVIFSINIIATIHLIRKIIAHTVENITDYNFHRSTGEEPPISNLGFMTDDYLKWVPNFLKNHLAFSLKDKTTSYLLEDSIASRERSAFITKKIMSEETWFFSYKYEDLISILNTLRSLYIPMGVLCSLVVFITGYSQITTQFVSPSVETISKNIFIISFTIKTAGFTLAIGIFGYVLSSINSIFTKKTKISDELTETLFQLKSSNVKIQID